MMQKRVASILFLIVTASLRPFPLEHVFNQVIEGWIKFIPAQNVVEHRINHIKSEMIECTYPGLIPGMFLYVSSEASLPFFQIKPKSFVKFIPYLVDMVLHKLILGSLRQLFHVVKLYLIIGIYTS